jgi:tRNA(adenine34) deaminase
MMSEKESDMDILAPEISTLDLAAFMQAALQEAELAGQAGEYPIGAVIVIDGGIISRGRATHNAMKSQVRHAELNAILAGGEPLWRDFRRAILFTTLEPCVLCLGAAVMADIPHIIFALPDKNMQSGQIVATIPYVRRHIRSYHGGVLAEESAALLARYDPKSLEYIQGQILKTN